MKKKNLRPIDFDSHFKYRCPNDSCGFDHWLSFKQVKIKNFKVVCDCGTIFIPKQISKIKILFTEDKKNEIPKTKLVAPIEIKDRCRKLLVSYGFTENESDSLVNSAYKINSVNDPVVLVRYIIKNFGVLDDNN